eukprot:s3690_g8.t1
MMTLSAGRAETKMPPGALRRWKIHSAILSVRQNASSQAGMRQTQKERTRNGEMASDCEILVCRQSISQQDLRLT